MSTTRTLGIDALFFPHIVDHIITLLCDNDPLTAAKLQVVCRSWNAKIRSHLFTHIWIDHYALHYCYPSRHTTYKAFNIRTIPVRPGPSLWFAVQLESEVPSTLRHPLIDSTLRTARVIDVRSIASLLFLPQPPNLQTLRFGPKCLNQDVPSDTLVIFKDPGWNQHYYSLTTRKLAKKIVIYSYQMALAFQDLICHDEDDDPPKLLNLVNNNKDRPDVLENVTVFYPFPPEEETKLISLYNDIMIEDVSIIEDRFGPDHNRTLTLVSPDSPPVHAPNPLEPSWTYFKSRLQNEAAHLLENLEFLTAAEYRERIGEAAYNLHTTWSCSATLEPKRPRSRARARPGCPLNDNPDPRNIPQGIVLDIPDGWSWKILSRFVQRMNFSGVSDGSGVLVGS